MFVVIAGLTVGLLPSAQAGDEFFDSAGVKIRYVVAGKGEPVVLIHGFSGNLELQWQQVPKLFGQPDLLQALAKDYQVIALDCRGHGKSDKPADPKAYGREMAEDVVRLLDYLKIKKAHLVGYSMGGKVVLKVIADHPERVLTATLGGSAGVQLDDDLTRYEDRAGQYDKSGQKVLAAVSRSYQALAVPAEKLKANKVPVLALYGSKESDQVIQDIHKLKGRLTKVQVVVIEGATHMNAPGRPEFLKGLQGFHARVP
jgi:pimeloyl-ACP methyl ester carboxylesterase